MMLKRTKIPTRDEYKQTISQLTETKNLNALIAVRMGCELGLTRIEIANARVTDLDRINKRGLWIEVAKKVRRGKKKVADRWIPNFQMRQREIPVNTNFYQLLISYIDKNQVYIIKRTKGDVNKPFTTRYINTIYDEAKIPWASHKSRHFFKNCVKDWMRNSRQIDDELIKDLMGHKKDQTEQYGGLSWDYKLSVIDKVFP